MEINDYLEELEGRYAGTDLTSTEIDALMSYLDKRKGNVMKVRKHFKRDKIKLAERKTDVRR